MKNSTAAALLSDPIWRLNHLYQVTNPQGQRVPFRLNPVQAQLISQLHSRNIVLKARQLGITTALALWQLDRCLFESDLRCGIIAHTREDAQFVFRDKIKFAYDCLSPSLQGVVSSAGNSRAELMLSNNSGVRVGVSMRSGTLQVLHISEFGKICARYPDKAREIITGSLNTVHSEQTVVIESTAEGSTGYFKQMCDDAMRQSYQTSPDQPLSKEAFRFFFFPWWQEPSYCLASLSHAWPVELDDYFSTLSAEHAIQLSDEQKQWYGEKWRLMGADTWREFPSIPEEAFKQTTEGAYYAKEMLCAWREQRVTAVAVEPSVPVDTWWDLGFNDSTAIWFSQRVGSEIRLIDYYENSGESLQHYLDYIKGKAKQASWTYGSHYAPHDMGFHEYSTGKTRLQLAQERGVRFTVAPRVSSIQDRIDAVRRHLQHCVFDETRCTQGVRALESYRKEWNDHLGVWRDQPRHDWASHAADAFGMLALAYDNQLPKTERRTIKRRQWRFD